MSTESSRDRERVARLFASRFPGVASAVERIPAGLGDRRFYRVRLAPGKRDLGGPTDAPRTLIARIEPDRSAPAPPSTPFSWLPEPPLEPTRTFLENSGLPVPRSYAFDPELGIDLLEDVGDRTLADTDGQDQRARYLEAAALIPKIQALRASPQDIPAFGRTFDARLVRTKAAKVIAWSWPGLLGREASAQEREAIEGGFDAIAGLLQDAPRRLSHRDFKAENLHLAPRVSGTAHDERERLVMIDVQGAFMAPPEYDAVCLLRDLQVDLPESLVEEVSESIRRTLPDVVDEGTSRQRFDAIAVVRLAKDLAHIVDAGRSRGDRRRWAEIPRGLKLLEAAVEGLERTFPAARALNFVMHVLTQGAETSDIQPSGKR